MNFQSRPFLSALRVLVVNPLSPAAQMTIVKMMSGSVFGKDQLIDLTLLVYANEITAAEDFKLELHTCGFSCLNSVRVSSDLPVISDADVFCFITNFQNPNSMEFYEIDNDQFDVLYLLIKIANSLSKPVTTVEESEENPEEVKKEKRPIIMADGIVTLNILKYFTEDIPNDVFFCPTPLPIIAKNVIADYLKVQSNAINYLYVWAANDIVFHIEAEKPIIVGDKTRQATKCDWDLIGKSMLEASALDQTQFNECWLKKDFIEKVRVISSKNPYGNIYRACEFARALAIVWKARSAGANDTVNASIGVISNGSLGTIKGFAYVLPIIFSGDTWIVDKRFIDTSFLQQELQRLNQAVNALKEKLIPYCKKFLQENVINLAFVPSESSEISRSTMGDSSR